MTGQLHIFSSMHVHKDKSESQYNGFVINQFSRTSIRYSRIQKSICNKYAII